MAPEPTATKTSGPAARSDAGRRLDLDRPVLERPKLLLVAAVALTVPLGLIPVRILGQPLFLFDAPLALLYIVGGWSLYVRRKRGDPARLALLPSAFLAFLALCLVALVVHPSVAGAVLLLRLGAGGVLTWSVSGLSRRFSGYAAGALLASAVLQAVLAMAQFFRRKPIGLRVLGEGSAPLNRLGNVLIPRGTFDHQYPLTAFCLLAVIVGVVAAGQSRHPWRWLGATILAVVPLGVTFSRSGVLGLVLALACFGWVAWRHDRRYGLFAICLGVALVLAGTLAARGWSGRIYQTVHSPTVNAFSSGRVTMYQDSVDVARANPIIGIGPGRDRAGKIPVNDVFLLISEQAGIVAALLGAAVVVLLGKRALAQGPLALSIFLCLLLFVLFDYFLYGIPQGPAMAGLWAGAVCSPFARLTLRRPSNRV